MHLRIKVDSWSPRIPSGVRWTGSQTNSLQPQHKTHRKTLLDWICPGPTCLGEVAQEDLYHEVRLPEHLRGSIKGLNGATNIYSISFWDPNTCCQSSSNHFWNSKMSHTALTIICYMFEYLPKYIFLNIAISNVYFGSWKTQLLAVFAEFQKHLTNSKYIVWKWNISLKYCRCSWCVKVRCGPCLS